MDSAPKSVRVLSDGRPGHENQSVGLAEAIARRSGARVEIVRFAPADWLWDRYRKATARPADLLIAAGHKTHLTLSLAARKLNAKSVVIMSPSWPLAMFDLCLAPQHDLRPGRLSQPRVISTFGALNRLPEVVPNKQSTGLVLVGGPSKSHGWAAIPAADAIVDVITARPDLAWTIADSRRTPAGFLDQLRQRKLKAQIVPHTQTKPDWLPAQLGAAEEAWPTADSVSMIFEAVTAGARTGVLPAPARKAAADPVRAVEELFRTGHATSYETWKQNGQRLPAPKPLHETARCADLVLARLFSK
jgi:mitochondrial fission protein ELM1